MFRLALLGIMLTGALASPCAHAGGDKVIPDVVYGHKDGLALTFDVLKPESAPNGIGILFIMSSGWTSNWVPPDEVRPWFTRLLDKGFTVFVVRHGSCPRYTITDARDDVLNAVAFIQNHAGEYGVDPNRLGATSFSAGAHLSLMIALTPQSEDKAGPNNGVGAVVAFCPPVDFTFTGKMTPPERFKLYKDLGKFDRKALSPIKLVTPSAPPTLLLVGDKDWLYEGVLRMHKTLLKNSVPTDLQVFPGGDHAWSNADQKAQAEEAMVAWFERYLLNKPQT